MNFLKKINIERCLCGIVGMLCFLFIISVIHGYKKEVEIQENFVQIDGGSLVESTEGNKFRMKNFEKEKSQIPQSNVEPGMRFKPSSIVENKYISDNGITVSKTDKEEDIKVGRYKVASIYKVCPGGYDENQKCSGPEKETIKCTGGNEGNYNIPILDTGKECSYNKEVYNEYLKSSDPTKSTSADLPNRITPLCYKKGEQSMALVHCKKQNDNTYKCESNCKKPLPGTKNDIVEIEGAIKGANNEISNFGGSAEYDCSRYYLHKGEVKNPSESCEVDSSSKKYFHDLEKNEIDIGGKQSYINNMKACRGKKDKFCKAINNMEYNTTNM